MENKNRSLKTVSYALIFIGFLIMFVAAFYFLTRSDKEKPSPPDLDEITMTVDEFNSALGNWEKADIPEGDFLINITGMEASVKLEIRDTHKIHAVYAYNYKAEPDFSASYQTYLFNYRDAVIISNGISQTADTYILTENGIDRLHKGDDFTYTLSVSEDKLRYKKANINYVGADQYISSGVNVATGWDDIYYQEGDAEIKNGKVVFGKADVTVLANDCFHFKEAFEYERIQNAYNNTPYYDTIEDLFKANKIYEVKDFRSVAKPVTEEEKEAVISALNSSLDYLNENYRISVGEKYIIDDEVYFTVTIENCFADEWQISSVNIINQAFTKMYKITYTVDGKSFRWSTRRNSLPNESTLNVPDLGYEGIDLIPPVPPEQIGSGRKVNYTCIGLTPVTHSALDKYCESRPDDISLVATYGTIVITSREELIEIIETLAPYSNLEDSGYEDIPSFNQISSYYNQEYFKTNSLILVPRYCLNKIFDVEINDINVDGDFFSAQISYKAEDDDTPPSMNFSKTWLITVEMPNEDISDCKTYAIK